MKIRIYRIQGPIWIPIIEPKTCWQEFITGEPGGMIHMNGYPLAWLWWAVDIYWKSDRCYQNYDYGTPV